MTTSITSPSAPSIGILGAGAIGTAVAKVLARHGIAATIANSRGPDSLAELVRELGPSIQAGTREQAAAKDIVLVAVNWPRLGEALAGLPDFAGRIVIDANNPISPPEYKLYELNGRTSTEVFADFVPGARVVKAFNHLFAHLVLADPAAEGGKRVMFYSGEDAAANATVGALIERLGFAGIDLGPLAIGGKLAQFTGGVLPGRNLVQFG
jgi:8-hydroxy-5-deazaflavin:NADPH oxidoreductase